MLRTGHEIALGRSVHDVLIGDQCAGRTALLLKGFLEELVLGHSIAAALYKDIEDVAGAIDGSPQIVRLAFDS